MDNDHSIIDKFIIEKVAENFPNVAKLAAEKFGISVQSVNRHLKKLEEQGIIGSEGKTKGKKYYLLKQCIKYDVDINSDSKEDELWKTYIKPHLFDVSKNVFDICQYGLTEMINNVIDHSQSKKLNIELIINPEYAAVQITDSGIGIFEKIKTGCNLKDHLEAMQELVKGKLTTDPDRHNGEGIFFTSRMFDKFHIISGKLHYVNDPIIQDHIFELKSEFKGTQIIMEIKQASKTKVHDVFKEYTNNDFVFYKTVIPLVITQFGEDNLVSRSQAKKLLSGVEKFKEIVLDFKGVESIGQAFADEIFRVFAKEHSDICFIAVNTNEDIDFMIKRAQVEQFL